MADVLAKMSVEISSDTTGLGKGLDTARGKLDSFSSQVGKIGVAIGIAFAAKKAGEFAFEVAKLAGEAEGVSAAFNKLPNSVELMGRLKQATAGTVSELELMKRTVQASNFEIDLQALPDLLKFATLRAQQTGQSVDYLVDSIVTGIGRKSPLILDNLGISASALKEKLGGVSIAAADIGTVSKAVGDIASDQLKKMGDFSENTSTKVQRLNASWENFKVTLGNAVNNIGVIGGALDFLTVAMGGVVNAQKDLEVGLRFLNEGGAEGERYAEVLAAVEKTAKLAGVSLIKLTDEVTGLTKVMIDPRTKFKVIEPATAQAQIQNLDALQDKVKQLNEEFQATDITDQLRLTNIGKEIIATNEQIKVLEELRKARSDSGKDAINPNSVNAYNEALKRLNNELNNTNALDLSRIRILSAQIVGYDQAIAKIEAMKKSMADFDDTIQIPDLSPLAVNMEEVSGRFEAALKRMSDAARATGEQVKASIAVDMAPLVSNAISGIAEAIGNAAAGVGNFGQGIIKVVAGFARQLGEILIASGTAMLITKKLMISNPALAIGAGVALVAIATAAGAAISKSHGSSFGGGSVGGVASSGRGVSQASATQAQDVKVVGDVQIRGQDLFVILSNYNNNNRFTKAGG